MRHDSLEKETSSAAGSARPTGGLTPRVRAGLAILGLLAAVWIANLPERRATAEAGAARPRSPEELQAIASLQLAALERTVPVFEPRRNIFAFASSPADPRESEAPLQQPIDHRIVERKDPPAPDPAPDIAFLGVFGPQRLRIGVIKGKSGESVANILEGDVVEGRYRVLDIDPKSILLHDLASPDAPPISVRRPGSSSTRGHDGAVTLPHL
jgi:hypothetical protein